mgnify:CR=1 FL=1
MKLGNVVQIAIGVPDLEASASFYEMLEFEKLAENDAPWPWKQYTDGQNLLLLNQDGNQYIGLNYFTPHVTELVAAIEANGIPFIRKQVGEDGRLQMALFSDDDGLMVALINHDPTGMTLPTGEPMSKCGTFGEFSLGVDNFQKASHFWQQFGFKEMYASGDPYPWGILSDEMIVLGLHQTDEFKGPCITYFEPDMAERVNDLQAKGLVIENGILNGPAGETLFLFTGEL